VYKTKLLLTGWLLYIKLLAPAIGAAIIDLYSEPIELRTSFKLVFLDLGVFA